MSTNSLDAKSKHCNLNFKTMRKMVHRLLTQERIKTELDEGRIINHESSTKPIVKVKAYTKKELAEKIGISLEELEKLKLPNFYRNIANKISLPLARLYCATKFVDDKY